MRLPIDKRYEQHRLQHPDAAPWDKVINYALNGNEFGRPIRYIEWQNILKVNKNTPHVWVPLIMQWIMDNELLSEVVADAIVQANRLKPKGR